MNAVENLMLAGAAAAYEKRCDQAQAVANARADLSAQVVCAIFGNPLAKTVECPGQAAWSAVDLVGDHFAGTSGDADLAELLALVAGVARQLDNPLQARALALISRVADEYAAFHADDKAQAELAWEAA